MNKQARNAGVLSVILYLSLIFGPEVAHAQNIRSWVAAAGNDNSNCTFAAPCASFSAAYAKTNPGG